MKKHLLILTAFIFVQYSMATVWHIGPAQTYTMPSQVSTLVQDGDTVEIDAGIYASDVAHWIADNLLLRGINGFAQLPSGGLTYGGKAIWVIGGNNTTVEHIEFSQAACIDKNGAGIRQEGQNLTVRHCNFHDNEEGILAGTVNPSTILIEYTEFGHNGYGDGYSHNLYINNIDTLIFRYNYTHHTRVGHELKSRAHINFIEYNRISDEDTGSASRSIDLPNGGISYIIGNVIEQGPLSQNSNIIGYGLEGLTNPAPHEVYAVNNTIVNNYPGGSFFQFQQGTSLFKAYNNIIAGSGSFIAGNPPATLDTASNRISTSISSFSFVNSAQYDYHLSGSSASVINAGTNPGTANTVSLNPVMEYVHPANTIVRCISGSLDIGSYEYCTLTGIGETTSFNGIIYPNPAQDRLYISFSSDMKIKVIIINTEGRKIRETGFMNTNGLTLDISDLAAGTYFLKLQDEKKFSVMRFTKQCTFK